MMGIYFGLASGKVICPFILREYPIHNRVIASLRFIALGNSKGLPPPGSYNRTWLTCMLYLADIVKMIESQPDLASQIRRVRGGYLKIQGTWMPYEVFCSAIIHWPVTDTRNRLLFVFLVGVHDWCFYFKSNPLTSCYSVAWPIRHDLVPLFGYVI